MNLTPNDSVHIVAVPRYLDRIGAVPWKSVSSGQSESGRSAALIAMPDSMGAATPTAERRRISKRPNESVLSVS